jgi:glycosyltransferase involved in cell wall biosynthesis
MKDTTPLISIGLPVYNGEKSLERAIISILDQDHPNIELIIGDNASTDSTQAICQKFLEMDSRVKYYCHNKNNGSSFNFNFVLKEAKGEFFTWAAYDDWLETSYIRRCVEELKTNPTAIGCCSEINFINEDGSIRQNWTEYYSNIDGLGKNVVERVREITSKFGWFAIYAVFNTNVVRQVSPWQQRYADDVLRLVELSIKGEIIKIPERLFNYSVPDVTKTPEDYAKTFNLTKKETDEVLKSPQTFIAKEVLRVVYKSDLKIDEKHRIKEDIIYTLATLNSDWLGRIITENNSSLDKLKTNGAIQRFLKEIIVSEDIKEFFDQYPIETSSKVLVFFPHNPYPSKTGAHRRCLEILSALKELDAHPLRNRIELIQGSSIDPQIVKKVHTFAKNYDQILVSLDSNHTHEHVLAELEAYSNLVTPESYCIVFDTVIEDLPEDTFQDRPWGKGDNPKTAVWEFLKTHPEFEIDREIQDKLLITVAPDGFLKKK